jgi:hypothetical protein
MLVATCINLKRIIIILDTFTGTSHCSSSLKFGALEMHCPWKEYDVTMQPLCNILILQLIFLWVNHHNPVSWILLSSLNCSVYPTLLISDFLYVFLYHIFCVYNTFYSYYDIKAAQNIVLNSRFHVNMGHFIAIAAQPIRIRGKIVSHSLRQSTMLQ